MFNLAVNEPITCDYCNKKTVMHDMILKAVKNKAATGIPQLDIISLNLFGVAADIMCSDCYLMGVKSKHIVQISNEGKISYKPIEGQPELGKIFYCEENLNLCGYCRKGIKTEDHIHSVHVVEGVLYNLKLHKDCYKDLENRGLARIEDGDRVYRMNGILCSDAIEIYK